MGSRSWAYVWSSLHVTPDEMGNEAFATMERLFATTARITFAAIMASAGAFVDIMIFEFIKNRFTRGFVSQLWLRNNLSTIIGQTANTTLLFTLALYGEVETNALISIIVTATIVKVAIAVFDTPVLYLARKMTPNTGGAAMRSVSR